MTQPGSVQRKLAEVALLGYNMSGCSGGPVLTHGSLNGRQRCFPIAMIIMAPREKGTGEAKGQCCCLKDLPAFPPVWHTTYCAPVW